MTDEELLHLRSIAAAVLEEEGEPDFYVQVFNSVGDEAKVILAMLGMRIPGIGLAFSRSPEFIDWVSAHKTVWSGLNYSEGERE